MRSILYVPALLVAFATGAHAEFYPYYSGAAHMRGTRAPAAPTPPAVTITPYQAPGNVVAAAPTVAPTPASALPDAVVPQRYYAPSYGAAPAPAAYATSPHYIAPPPAYTPPPAPAYSAPQPQQYAAATAYPPAGYAQPYEAPAATPPASAPSAFQSYYQPQNNIGKRANSYYLGLEGYYDRYQEDSVDLDNNGLFGSLTYGFEHYFTPTWYMDFDGRSSYGRTHYSSVSGEISQIPGFELDHSLIAGYDMHYGNGRHFKPYIGLGLRYFNEKAKGEVTDSSPPANGYDRRFYQFYMPVGMAFEAPVGDNYIFRPVVEFAPMLYGYGQSRFQNLGGEALSHVQHHGYRFKAEAMWRSTNARGYGFEFGPFLRYWNVDDSELDTNGGVFPSYYIEPENARLQAGFSAKFLF